MVKVDNGVMIDNFDADIYSFPRMVMKVIAHTVGSHVHLQSSAQARLHNSILAITVQSSIYLGHIIYCSKLLSC